MSQYKIKDIAEKAGVCSATVSRALRKPELVQKSTRDKIMKIIDELNFRPSKLAASLRQGQSGNIVLIIPDITNPYFSSLTRGVEKYAKSKGYSVLLGDTREDSSVENHFADMVLSRQADGIIICSQRMPYETSKFTADSNLPPIVSTADVVDDEQVCRVVVDNVKIGYDGIRYLFSLGHRNIAVIAGSHHHRNSVDRLRGVRKAFAEAGRELDDAMICFTDYVSERAARGATDFVAMRDRPTAIFCFGDMLAIGVIRVLTKLGYRIPDDVSVLGVDDIFFAELTIPSLSTIAQPIEKIGEACVDLLIQQISRQSPTQKLTLIPHTLVERESTAPPQSA